MEPTRDEIDRMNGAVVLEFGASWCGHCRAVKATVDELREQFPNIRHLWVEDGPGQPLGRSFFVKLWPTFIFLKDGTPTHREVRPSPSQLSKTFADFAAAQANDNP